MTGTATDGLDVERCDDPDEWDAFVERNGGTAFATWGWGDAVETYGHDRYFLVAREAGDPVGVLPLFHVKSRLFGDELVSLPYSSKGSVVARADRREAAIRALLDRTVRLADDLDVDATTLRSEDLGDTRWMERRNRYVSFQVPVGDGVEATWEGMKDSRRRQVEQAMDDGALRYERGDSIEDLRDFYRLYLRSMRGHGSPPHSFEFFRVLWDRLHDAGRLRLALVRLDGDVVNGVIDLMLGSTVVQKGVFADYEHRDRNGGSLIHWKSLEWAAENGYETYDLGRTREGSGVYMFKKSFGGEKVWLDDYHYFPDGEVDLPDPSQEKYQRLQDVWRRLPVPVTRVVGPSIRKSITL